MQKSPVRQVADLIADIRADGHCWFCGVKHKPETLKDSQYPPMTMQCANGWFAMRSVDLRLAHLTTIKKRVEEKRKRASKNA